MAPTYIGGRFVEKKKYKRSYFPLMRKLMKELEDAIIERKQDKENKVRRQLIEILNEIEKLKYVDD